MGKTRARLFLGLLILSIVCLQIPSAFATSISVQYSTNDGIEIGNDVSVLHANGSKDSTITNAVWDNENLVFDGNNDYITITDETVITDSDWTAIAWINSTDTSGYQVIFEKNLRPTYIQINPSGTFQIYWYGATPAFLSSTNALITENLTYHICAVYVSSGKYFHLYVNGVKITALDANQTGVDLSLTSDPTHLSQNTEYGLIGTLYEAKKYGRILSSNEVLADFNLGVRGGLIANTNGFRYWFKLDESSGTKAYGYNDIDALTTLETPQTLAISQTASAVNSSLIPLLTGLTDYPDKWILANSTHPRINTTTLQTLLFDHYVYLNFLVSPTLSGSFNVTDGYYKTLVEYGILASNSLGYYFKGWYYDGTMSSSENPTSFTPLDNGTLTGVFSSTSTSAYSSVETSEPTLFLYLGLIGLFATLLLGWKLHPFFFVVGIGFGVYLFFMEWDTVITFANATGIYQTTKTFRPMNWWYALIAGLMAMQSLIFMLQVVDRT